MAKPRNQWGDARLVRAINENFGGALYHLTDEANAASIGQHGLLSKSEAEARGIHPSMSGGTAMTRYFDERDGLSDHVFLSFFQSVLMPKDDTRDRHRRRIVLAIDPKIILQRGVQVRLGRGAHAPSYSAMRAIYEMDWEILSRPDLQRNPVGGKARWVAFLNYEVLIPKCVPREFILGIEE